MALRCAVLMAFIMLAACALYAAGESKNLAGTNPGRQGIEDGGDADCHDTLSRSTVRSWRLRRWREQLVRVGESRDEATTVAFRCRSAGDNGGPQESCEQASPVTELLETQGLLSEVPSSKLVLARSEVSEAGSAQLHCLSYSGGGIFEWTHPSTTDPLAFDAC